jgi:hypothetical protein
MTRNKELGRSGRIPIAFYDIQADLFYLMYCQPVGCFGYA